MYFERGGRSIAEPRFWVEPAMEWLAEIEHDDVGRREGVDLAKVQTTDTSIVQRGETMLKSRWLFVGI
jgi:hypothetical protein